MVIYLEPIKDTARRAAKTIASVLPDAPPQPIATYPKSVDLVSLKVAKEQRKKMAEEIFPGLQHYGDGGFLCVAQIVQQLTKQRLDEIDLLIESITDGNAQRQDGKFTKGPFHLEMIDHPTACGNTTINSLQEILKKRGIESSIEQVTSGNLEEALESKHGVIIQVDVAKFWQHKGQFLTQSQFILVVDGDFDKERALVRVYVNDTGAAEKWRAVPIKDFADAVYDLNPLIMLVTKNPIWP
ncbi:MAG: hypothetical protein AB1489_01940 [Acidobacteriota bacterium]